MAGKEKTTRNPKSGRVAAAGRQKETGRSAESVSVSRLTAFDKPRGKPGKPSATAGKSRAVGSSAKSKTAAVDLAYPPSPQPARQAVRERVAEVSPLVRPAQNGMRRYREELRQANLESRVRIEREGVPYFVVKELIQELGTSTAEFQQMVGMPKATFAKKIAQKELFSGASGQSVVGLIELINKVEDMLDPRNPAAANFDVEAWVGQWIRMPQPALGGEQPANLMDTPSGRQSVMRVLGALASGAYL
ncbi:MAG: DUF2384 domain-containing protein [Lysobacteraceae bacterium]|nr:MAG: DUF2384 domain-containing protein [Xanthomonadaceae bacterium]